MMEKLHCQQCEYEWQARVRNVKMCPQCKSRKWNKPYDPDEGIEMVPFPKPVVMAIDQLLDFAKKRRSPNGLIETEGDWEVVEMTVRFWQAMYPTYYKQFVLEQKKRWKALINDHGSAAEGGAQVRHLIEIPEKLDRLLLIMFPGHKWSHKDFLFEFAKRLPLFKGFKKK